MRSALCVVVALALLASSGVLSQSAPFLAWSPIEGAFNAKTTTQLSDVLREVDAVMAKPGVLVVFVQDQLSVEDFTRFGAFSTSNCFQKLQTRMEDAASSLSMATNDKNFRDSLLAHIRSKAQPVSFEATDASFELPAAQTSEVFIVHLPNTDKSESLTVRNDGLINSVLSKISAARPNAGVSALLTAADATPLPLPAQTAATHTIRERRDTARAGASGGFDNLSLRRYKKDYAYFTIPIFMGVLVFLFCVVVLLIGVVSLMSTQTPEQFASPQDKPLQVPQN